MNTYIRFFVLFCFETMRIVRLVLLAPKADVFFCSVTGIGLNSQRGHCLVHVEACFEGDCCPPTYPRAPLPPPSPTFALVLSL